MALKQKQLECPFTWGLEKQWARDFNEMEEPITKFEDEPLLAFISAIILTYVRAEKKDYQGASANLMTTNDIWEKLVDMRQLETIGVSRKVLRHVKIATEYFIHDLTGCKEEAEDLLKKLESSESFQSICEIATIDGCKSVAWLSCHEEGDKKAQVFARSALSKSPNCALWHYNLGKSLRHSRREIYGNFNPSSEEQDAIIKSCELSMTPFYKIFLAQMYREKLDYSTAQDIYLEVFLTKPKNAGILLRLAAGFIFIYNDFVRAKKCLDEVQKNEQSSMYYHIMGVFYSKQKKYKNAALHYEIAAMKGKNYKADLQYAQSLQKLDKDFNLIQHLKKMLDKYENIKYKQQMFLHIAMHYYFRERDIAKSLSHFLQAIELRSGSQQLTIFFNSTIDFRIYNIYEFVRKILQYNEWYCSESSNPKCNDLRKLEEYCKQYQEAQLTKSVENITL